MIPPPTLVNESPRVQPSSIDSTSSGNTSKLVSSISKAHQLKIKIADFKEELAKLEKEYEEIKQSIVVQL